MGTGSWNLEGLALFLYETAEDIIAEGMSAPQPQPWQKDPKYIQHVCISASAAMKMLEHAKSGIDKGLASANRMPVEVMGFLHIVIDSADPRTLVVMDAFEVDADGSEGAVVTDNLKTQNIMVKLADNLERTRVEKITGWYHSHPFEMEPFPLWFLSDTDVTSQRSWQMGEDRYFPFLALVVDPFRGLSKGRPEIGAFRTLPPSYTPPPGMGPDGVSAPPPPPPPYTIQPQPWPATSPACALTCLRAPPRPTSHNTTQQTNAQARSGLTRPPWRSGGAPPTSPTTAFPCPTSPTLQQRPS
jgi:proteasome lid subunit RPN8/RPN11